MPVYLLLFSLLVLAYPGAPCSAAPEGPEWRKFSESDAFQWYYDPKSIERRDKGIVRVWAKSLVKGRVGVDEKVKLLKKFGGQARGYENYSYTINLFEINCAKQEQRVTSVTDCDAKGNTLETAIVENYPWGAIPPGTIIYNLSKIVCEQK